jgi:hypothetical protein
MKQLLCFTFLVFLFACKKEPAKPALPEGYYGTASAERNGKPWTAHPSCWIDLVDHTNLVVELDSLNEDFYTEESLIIDGIPPFLGTYRVYKFKIGEDHLNANLSMWDEDQPLGYYELIESDSNTNLVSLTSYDTLSKEIKGTFNLSFIVSERPYSSYPDTIRFKNGKFSGKIIKK